MASKQIMFQDAALLEMKKGVDRLAEAVKCTMGPSGRHVVIERSARHQGPRLLCPKFGAALRNDGGRRLGRWCGRRVPGADRGGRCWEPGSGPRIVGTDPGTPPRSRRTTVAHGRVRDALRDALRRWDRDALRPWDRDHVQPGP